MTEDGVRNCEAVCPTPGASASTPCPQCGTRGRTVESLTVAALTRGVVPPHQQYRLCCEPECDAVYFGEDGVVISAADLNVAPGFKSKERRALLCYCFQHRRGDIEDELLATGRTAVPAQITAEMKAGNCACEVRNPSGRCCLGEVAEAAREIGEALAISDDRP